MAKSGNIKSIDWPAEKVERRPVESLIPYKNNARTHSESQVAQIAASIKEYGFTVPVLIDPKGNVIAGHGRIMAAKALGLAEIPVMVAKGWSAAKRRAYVILDNQVALNAGWDQDLLKLELTELQAEGFDIGSLGFDGPQLAAIIDTRPEGLTDPDEAPEPPAEPVSRRGDIWTLGRHRLMCGDSTSAEDVARLMGGQLADLCFTSPPYAQQRDYGAAKALVQDWDGLMRGVFQNAPMAPAGQILVNLGLVHRDGEWLPYWDGWIEWMREHGWRRFGWYVWDKGAGMPGEWNGMLAPAHEFLFHFTRGSVGPARKWVKTKPDTRGASGKRFRAKDGSLREISSPGKVGQAWKVPDSVVRITSEKSRGIHTQGHPAVYPVALPQFGIQTWPSGNVYEPFSGSGTTVMAAEIEGRHCFAADIDAAYCDIAITRWQNFTGQTATLDGKTFDQVKAERHKKAA